jgi:cell division septation protein DedD
MRNPDPDKKTTKVRKDVSAYLKELLYDQDRVFLPGLGTFVTQDQEARRDPLGGTIAPPTKIVQFNASLFYDDGSLKRVLAKEYNVSQKVSARLVNEYVQSLKRRLTRRREARITGLGILAYDQSGQIQFNPNKTNFRSDVYGLPKVNAQLLIGRPAAAPVSRPSMPLPSTTQPATAPGWFARNRILIAAAAFAVVIIAFLALIWMPEQNAPVSSNRNTPGITTPQNTEEEGVPALPPPEVIERNEQAVSESTPQPPQQPQVSRGGEAPAAKKKTYIILLGSYDELFTVQQVIVQIKEMGFEPYTERAEGGTLVGFRNSYSSDEEVEEALEIAQSEFTPDAYILTK